MRAIKLILLFFLVCRLGSAQPVSLEHDGIVIKEFMIKMPDGVQLAADLYMPLGQTPDEKLPVLLEYIPYRKTEGRYYRFDLYSYFIKRGYVVARVDIRGTGNSEGKLIEYEYSDQEQEDGEVVIDWLSTQSFSNGKVGMFGISWGGFNSLHLAMRKPPALKAIISLMSTDDLYEDDVHYIDGMMHVDAYEIGQDLANAMPGAPDFVIDDSYYKNRFETMPWMLIYKQQQRDGEFWNRASLNTDYTRLQVPAFLIGGWYDGYRDSPPKILQHAKVPVKAMIGPWNHTFPNDAVPPPAIEWRRDAVRWFDYWLKGIQNGILDEPKFSAFVRDYHEPGLSLPAIPGEWYELNSWPSAQHDSTLYLQSSHRLSALPVESGVHELTYKPSAGIDAGGSVMWWGDWALDQSSTDSTCLVYESQVLAKDVIIMGFPKVQLRTSASTPLAYWMVRLLDVAPDGKVTLITGAGFNGTHRYSSERPTAIVPNEVFQLDIELHFTSWTFRKGHQIRVAVGNAMWPMIWPTPDVMTTSLHFPQSKLMLPILEVNKLSKTSFPVPEQNSSLPGYKSIDASTNSGFAEVSGVKRDEGKKTVTVTAANSGTEQFPWGRHTGSEKIEHVVHEETPWNTAVRSTYQTKVELSNRTLTWEGILDFSSDKKYFYYDYTRNLYEAANLIRSKTWKKRIRRDFH